MNSTVGGHKVQDLLEKIIGINMYNLETTNAQLDAILGPFNLLPQLNYDEEEEDDDDDNGSAFPTIISLPSEKVIPENWLDYVTFMPNVTLAKFATQITSGFVLNWGIIERPDRKLAFQFLLKRRSPKKQISVDVKVTHLQPVPSTSSAVVNQLMGEVKLPN